MLKENSEALTGNDRYEGYNIDLIQAISEILGRGFLQICDIGLHFTILVNSRLQLHYQTGGRWSLRKSQCQQYMEWNDWGNFCHR